MTKRRGTRPKVPEVPKEKTGLGPWGAMNPEGYEKWIGRLRKARQGQTPASRHEYHPTEAIKEQARETAREFYQTEYWENLARREIHENPRVKAEDLAEQVGISRSRMYVFLQNGYVRENGVLHKRTEAAE